MIMISVYGSPGPQGSKKFVGRSKSGRGIMIESSTKVKTWREAVKSAALDVVTGTIIGAVEVEMIFYMPKPKSAPKGRVTWPDRRPDLSKLVRSTEDALTDAGVWEDDARIIRCFSGKAFAGENSDALRSPGAIIKIWPVEERNA